MKAPDATLMTAKRPSTDATSLARSVHAAGLQQRDDGRQLNDNLQAAVKAKGLVCNTTNAELFRAKLRGAGFYADWHKKFGAEPWALLEKYTGKLA